MSSLPRGPLYRHFISYQQSQMVHALLLGEQDILFREQDTARYCVRVATHFFKYFPTKWHAPGPLPFGQVGLVPALPSALMDPRGLRGNLGATELLILPWTKPMAWVLWV